MVKVWIKSIFGLLCGKYQEWSVKEELSDLLWDKLQELSDLEELSRLVCLRRNSGEWSSLGGIVKIPLPWKELPRLVCFGRNYQEWSGLGKLSRFVCFGRYCQNGPHWRGISYCVKGCRKKER